MHRRRRDVGAFLRAALVLLLLAAGAAVAGSAGAADGAADEPARPVLVSAVAPDARAATGAALAELAALQLRAHGVPAAAAPPPAGCGADAACRDRTLAALAAGAADAALLPLAAARAPSAPRLRDAGLEELGDAAPAARRACVATGAAAGSRPPLRSLLELAEPARAALYRLADDRYRALFCNDSSCPDALFTPEACVGDNSTCATLLTDGDDVRELEHVVRRHALLARVRAVGPLDALPPAAARLPLLLCTRAPALAVAPELRTAPLGPPPCEPGEPDEPCPFEPYRFVKVANVRALARSPTALRVLTHLQFSPAELRALAATARRLGPAAAARAHLAAHPPAAVVHEVRIGVLLPAQSPRDVVHAHALAAAAALAEEDLAAERLPRGARLKAELADDGCATPRAYKYLSDALGSGEYGALAGVAGPACGAAFADVARLSPTHALPVLAYTPQPAPAAGAPALLAAGETRAAGAALAALAARLGWRRLAVLSEAGSRPQLAALQQAAAPPDVLVHLELPDADPDLRRDLIQQWMHRVAAANARIVYLCVEDARAVRAALCAADDAGLRPAAGLVWLLAGGAPAWPGDRGCARRAAAGALDVVPAWQAAWDEAPAAAWGARLRARCAACAAPPAHAALLYDVLRLWARALDHLLAATPAATDDLHRRQFLRMLIENATSSNFTGLTGEFEWSQESGAWARVAPLVVRQWVDGAWRHVGRWQRGELDLQAAALRWPTADGRVPGDGREPCPLQLLADALHSDCRAAALALAASLLAALLAALAALALHCRRRAERERRERLRALDMRAGALAARPGLSRWELSRDRVVINRKLGTGAFGTVYGGHALLAEGRGWTAVAVKTLKAGASTEEKLDFLSEAEAMKSFDHKNIVRLLGVITKTAPVCTVMEFMLYGDLKNYLLARRHLVAADSSEDAAEEVSARQLTSMALDAARALSYLAQMRYVHRDLAARNCLVSARRVLKLADFGMTRLVFENDYYRLSRKGMLPVRWMAPESLELGVFSPASDVWSFGVLLYEIVTLGSLPFQGLSNGEVLNQVKAGHTLELPPGLKPQLEGLMKSCWQRSPRRRPAAAEIAAFLADWPRLLAPCPGAPRDALPLAAEARWLAADARWLAADARWLAADARWLAWAAPASNNTDATYLSDAPPADTDAFLPSTP